MKIDYEAELREYSWRDARWEDGRLRACSPFRDERKPSFYVWLRDDPVSNAKAGYWGDSGGSEYRRGGFVQLIAYLRNESEEEALEYLRAKYGAGDYGAIDPENLTLDFSDWRIESTRRQSLDPAILDEYRFRHPYLSGRGISEKVQRGMKIGYDRKRKAVTIPWFLADGSLGNIKYRKVDSKAFWYRRGGRPIREMVYGINVIYRKKSREAVLCEAEIDAMTAMTAGIPAVAVGGSKLSQHQAEIIARSPLERVIIAADNDEAGEGLKSQVIERLRGYVDLAVARLPSGCKDVNDVGAERLKKIVREAREIGAIRIVEAPPVG